jgi:hypothetical protein
MTLSLKISTDAASFLPSPMGFEARFPVVPPFGNSIYAAARNLSLHVSTSGLNLSMLSGFSLTLCFLAFTVIYQAHKLDDSNLDSLNVPAGLQHLAALRYALATSHPAAEGLLERIEAFNTPSEWRRIRNLASELSAANETSFAGFELFFDFDLASFGFPDSFGSLPA